ncbi:hypothetical protein GCM10027605_18830 [Micromonospora zhanjiangensis]
MLSLFLYRPAFLLVVAVAAGVGIWEMVRAVRTGSDARPPLVPLLVGGILTIGLAWWAGPDALTLGLLVTLLATAVWRLGDGPRGLARDMTASALIAVYVPFLGGFAAMLAEPADGDLRVLVTLAAVVLSDTGGYAAGVWLGRHPMAPRSARRSPGRGSAGRCWQRRSAGRSCSGRCSTSRRGGAPCSGSPSRSRRCSATSVNP